MRSLPGLVVCRLSEGADAPEAPLVLFRDWQGTQTQSSVKAARPESAHECLVLPKAGTSPGGTNAGC